MVLNSDYYSSSCKTAQSVQQFRSTVQHNEFKTNGEGELFPYVFPSTSDPVISRLSNHKSRLAKLALKRQLAKYAVLRKYPCFCYFGAQCMFHNHVFQLDTTFAKHAHQSELEMSVADDHKRSFQSGFYFGPGETESSVSSKNLKNRSNEC